MLQATSPSVQLLCVQPIPLLQVQADPECLPGLAALLLEARAVMTEPRLRLQQAASLEPEIEDTPGTIDPSVVERCHARALHQHASELLQVSWFAWRNALMHLYLCGNLKPLDPRAVGTDETHMQALSGTS